MGDGQRPTCGPSSILFFLQLPPLFFILLLLKEFSPVVTICPSKCHCQDENLTATCIQAGLEVVPIQLNPDVQVIRLSGNRIANVHYTLTFYTNLKHLDVSSNKLQSLGSKNFEFQQKLDTLNVSYNLITTLGKDAFKGLKTLTTLDVSHNEIEAIGNNSFKDTVSLKTIDLSYNKITSFEDPSVFMHIAGLKTLLLHNNLILDIPSGMMKNLPQPCTLETLTLNDNLIEIIDDKSFSASCSSSLKRLTLASNVIKEIDKSGFNALHNLAVLDLSFNNLTFIPTQQLSKMNFLTDLDLSGNTFNSVKPVAFQSLFQLRRLQLTRLPHLSWVDSRAFVDNIRLDSVNIDENLNLRRIPTRIFHGNPHLSHVSLKKNALSTVDVSHFPLDRLKTLDLSGNPFQCNCSLHWLWKLTQIEKRSPAPLQSGGSLNQTHQLRVILGNLKCASPESLRGHSLEGIPESTVSCETSWLTVILITALVLAVFSVTCIALLIFSSDKGIFPTCYCSNQNRKSGPCEDRDNEPESRRLAPCLQQSSAAPPPIIMLMPDKNYQDAILTNYGKSDHSDMKIVEPWMRNCPPRQNDYSMDMTASRKPHIVYV